MRLSPWRLLAPRCERSAPAQKAGDAPVTTMAPIAGSLSMASRVATISSTRSRVRALRRAGASRVTTATRSTVSVRSSGMAGSLALGGRYETASPEDFTQWARNVAPPIANLLNGQSPDVQEEVWRKVTEAWAPLTTVDGRVRTENQAIWVAATK